MAWQSKGLLAECNIRGVSSVLIFSMKLALVMTCSISQHLYTTSASEGQLHLVARRKQSLLVQLYWSGSTGVRWASRWLLAGAAFRAG